MKKVIISTLAVILFSLPVHAEYITSLSGPGVEITKVFIHENGAISLYISGSVLNLDECTSTTRVYIPAETGGKDAMLSAALMAYASGRKIGLHGSGCSTTHFWGGTEDVPIVNNLWVF